MTSWITAESVSPGYIANPSRPVPGILKHDLQPDMNSARTYARSGGLEEYQKGWILPLPSIDSPFEGEIRFEIQKPLDVTKLRAPIIFPIFV